ncbi:MAG: hypothetical protein ACYDEN_13290, partial [Acidimicrobiales bacterium]
PSAVRDGLSARVRAARSDLREAIQEGREAMADREEELRSQLGPARVPTAQEAAAGGRPALRVVGDPRPPHPPAPRPAGRSRRRRRGGP